jgi:hypothetical protein
MRRRLNVSKWKRFEREMLAYKKRHDLWVKKMISWAKKLERSK